EVQVAIAVEVACRQSVRPATNQIVRRISERYLSDSANWNHQPERNNCDRQLEFALETMDTALGRHHLPLHEVRRLEIILNYGFPKKIGQSRSPCPTCQSLLTNRFASIVSTTGTLVPSGSTRDWKIIRAWFPLLS